MINFLKSVVSGVILFFFCAAPKNFLAQRRCHMQKTEVRHDFLKTVLHMVILKLVFARSKFIRSGAVWLSFWCSTHSHTVSYLAAFFAYSLACLFASSCLLACFVCWLFGWFAWLAYFAWLAWFAWFASLICLVCLIFFVARPLERLLSILDWAAYFFRKTAISY